MKMSIDEATLYMELYKRKLFNSVSDLDKDIEAYDIAIDIMRKYQKITEIVAHYRENVRDKVTNENMEKILEVVEDGNDR